MSANEWEVIVKNVGCVYRGSNGAEAHRAYGACKAQAESQETSAGDEVYLLKNGHVELERHGSRREE